MQGGVQDLAGQAVVAAFRETPDAAAPSPLRRLTDPVYADGVAAPRAGPDAEAIAFSIFTQGDADIPSPQGLSALWIFWGQFVDHDLSLTPEQEGEEAAFVKFEAGSPFNVVRSEIVEGTGEDGVPAEQPNAITPLMDASQVYGSDGFRTLLLRSFEGGRLQAQPGADGVDVVPDESELFIPFLDDADLPPEYQGELEGFAAGDIRVSENAGLSAVHSLWLNEHNHWAGWLAERHPDWDDETLFHNARAIVETLIQKITYEAFLPPLIGDALPDYAGFDPGADGRISTEFATAAYRFGHTAIPDAFPLVAEDGTVGGAIPLFEAFEDDRVLLDTGLPTMLRGMLEEQAQALDTSVVDSLNFFLFTPDGGLTGFSLPERNILRGRDHGIDGWLAVRAAVLGDVDAEALADSTDFSLITSDAALAGQLAAQYGTLGEVDLWVGGLAEDAAPGAALGPTFRAIVAEQFAATRDADPLFHAAREWTDPVVESAVMGTGLDDILMRSGGIDHVQSDPFLASDRQGGTEDRDHIKGDDGRDLLIGFAGPDYLKGGAGDDDLFGGTGADMARGGAADDAISGGPGRDTLAGSQGDDEIAGGDGADLMVGGRGADRFVFAAGERGRDTVLDFEDGADRIVLEGFGGPSAGVEIRHATMTTTLLVGGEAVADFLGRDRLSLGESDIDWVG